MAYVIAAPEMMQAASTDLATIGSTLNAARMAAAPDRRSDARGHR
jgi:PE family